MAQLTVPQTAKPSLERHKFATRNLSHRATLKPVLRRPKHVIHCASALGSLRARNYARTPANVLPCRSQQPFLGSSYFVARPQHCAPLAAGLSISLTPTCFRVTLVATLILYLKFVATNMIQAMTKFETGSRPPEGNDISMQSREM
eukprot:1190050-Prorocentrum_minimum.AAC.6